MAIYRLTESVLEHVVSPKSLREAWKLSNYEQLTASASARGAPLLRYFTVINPQPYNRRAPKRAKVTDEADLEDIFLRLTNAHAPPQ